ncbi:MAG: transcription factor [Candidatus Nanoarchaeia archaeon]
MAATKLEVMLSEIGIELDDATLKVLSLLQKKKSAVEEEIAKKLKLKINDTRKLLYKLYEKRLAIYEKKADPKKKWWYIYYWSLDKDRIQELFLEYKRRQIEKKRRELEAERKFAFACKSCETKYQYEEALETEFTCPTCGSILEEAKPTLTAKRLQRELLEMETALAKEEAKLAKGKR